MRINLPNKITLTRLVLAIIFFVLLGMHDQDQVDWRLLDACLAIFIVAAATDYLDGYIARKTNEVTSLGRVLDPIVDKVLICGVFIYFASEGFNKGDQNVTGIAPWMVVLIVGRELLVTSLRGLSESHGQAYGAAFSGKLKMVVQCVTAALILLMAAHADFFTDGWAWVEIARVILIWATVALTLLSLLQYMIRSKQVFLQAAAR